MLPLVMSQHLFMSRAGSESSAFLLRMTAVILTIYESSTLRLAEEAGRVGKRLGEVRYVMCKWEIVWFLNGQSA